jgi:hypothetical protein
MRRGHRRAAFWVAVGGVSILANASVLIAADRLPQIKGLQTFAGYLRGRNGSS